MEIVQYILIWVDAHFWRLVGAWILLCVINAVCDVVTARYLKYLSKDWER